LNGTSRIERVKRAIAGIAKIGIYLTPYINLRGTSVVCKEERWYFENMH
jgi:hypothetical protein